MRKELVVCDVCEDPSRPVTTYTVTSEGGEGDTDRCAEHGADLEAILQPKETVTQSHKAAAAPRKRPGRPAAKVVSMEEVEAAKKQR